MRILALLLLLQIASSPRLDAQINDKRYSLQGGITGFITLEGSSAGSLVTEENGFRSSILLDEPLHFGIHIGVQKVTEAGWYRYIGINRLQFSVDDESQLLTPNSTQFPEPTGGRNRKTAILQLRYEVGKFLLKDQKAALQPRLGFAIDPSFRYMRVVPKTSAGFPYTYHQLGFYLHMVPGLQARLSSRLSLDIQVALGIDHFFYETFNVENPILREDERKEFVFSNEFGLLQLQPRLGVSFAL